MILDDEQLESVMSGMERDLAHKRFEDRLDKIFDRVGRWLTTAFLVAFLVALRLGLASGLAYLAWSNWPTASVFNTALAQLTLHDIGSVIFAPLFALAVPYLLFVGWEHSLDMLFGRDLDPG